MRSGEIIENNGGSIVLIKVYVLVVVKIRLYPTRKDAKHVETRVRNG
jgi:hypothetical protein